MIPNILWQTWKTIQSDPNYTFLHPEIKNKFIHNIGWTGKHQYDDWDKIFNQDETNKFKNFYLKIKSKH